MSGHLLVVGMARSGVAAANLAVAKGFRVVCTDQRADAPLVAGTEAHYGGHFRDDFTSAERIVVSPGVPGNQPDLLAAGEAGVRIEGELAFAASFLNVPVLAVSGTNGKSTTTHLLGQLLNNAGVTCFTGGNIGVPLSTAVDAGHTFCAVEVSSYQMEFPGAFRPRAAAILNLTPDHLERHGNLDNYAAHKCRMFARMGPEDAAILPVGEPRLRRLADALPGRRYLIGDSPGVRIEQDAVVLYDVHDPGSVSLAGFRLPGRHNLDNVAAAVLLAVCGGISRKDLDLSRLTGLPHRVEVLGERNGVIWVDDSKATNVDSALAAYRGWEGPFHALIGGKGKAGAAYEALVEPLRRARSITCFGEEGPEIFATFVRGELSPALVPRLADAVAHVRALAEAGDAVLLSPACASFDEFKDFEHRGRAFRALALNC